MQSGLFNTKGEYIMSKVTMSLNQIRAFKPCESGWKTLLKALNKTVADDMPIPLEFILESNGIQDAIWCMRVNWGKHRELYMEFVQGCVKRAKNHAAASTAAAASAADAVAAADYDDAYAAASAAAYAAAYDAVAAADDDYISAAYDDAYAAERNKQKEHLLKLLTA